MMKNNNHTRPLFLVATIIIDCLLFINDATAQKRIYIPEDMRSMDLRADTSQWSFHRSAETQDVIFFWERGFGNDTANPPQLDGHSMSFSLPTLMQRVQQFYTFFRDTLGFVNSASSKSSRYKMMVMVQYSLDGTAYGGTYDNYIGALWVAPNRIQDTTMNCMAHELGHSFQLQIPADSAGEAWGGSGFYEMTSQWMLWQVNPWWLRDENYHFEAFRKLTHKAYLHMENIYHSPYVIQWWSDLHGRKSIAELYRQGRRGEDPVITYKRMYGLTQQQFCDEMFQGYQHLMNFDFRHARHQTRRYACTFTTRLDTLDNGWLRPLDVPEAYGFNAIPLSVPRPGTKVSVRLQGDQLRYGFVGITADGHEIYSPLQTTSFHVPSGQPLKCLYFIVMGAPDTHQPLFQHGEEGNTVQFPYLLKVDHL